MGLFDAIAGTVNKISSEFEDAYYEAMEWDVYKISKRIKSTSKFAKRTAYGKALKEQCQGMDNSELKLLFEELRDARNGVAMNYVADVLVDRGILYRDGEGKLHKC